MANENYSEVTMQVIQLLRKWEEEHTITTYDPIPTLEKLAEIIEIEFENYLKMDPDPFDERHPSRADPECNLGHILKVLFRKDNFMNKLINDYLRETYYRGLSNPPDVRKLNTAACRLMLDILPGLDTSAVFSSDMDSLIQRLFSWAEHSEEPLQCYATGLLAAAMEIQDIATSFREQNGRMVPLMLKRLRCLEEKYSEELQQSINNSHPFALFGKNGNNCSNEKILTTSHKRKARGNNDSIVKSPNELFFSDDDDDNNIDNLNETSRKKMKKNNDNDDKLSAIIQSNNSYPDIMSPPLSIPKNPNNHHHHHHHHHHHGTPTKINNDTTPPPPPSQINQTNRLQIPTMVIEDNSNSSWAELESHVIGNIKIYPPKLSTQQILILRYLTPIGQYQEFLGHVFEQNAVELILKYINIKKTKDSRLAFEALKYLGSLLYHKKFSIEFLRMNGLQKLLYVPRPSVAATGVSICLYYLAYCEDAMERICLMSKQIIEELVTYVLWLLETSHDSSRCHATMFFGLSFQFKIILDEFDSQDGLRKLFNVITTLKIFNPVADPERDQKTNDDEEYAARQVIRHVATVLKKYMEAHLYSKAEQLQRHENARTDRDTRQASTIPAYKPCKLRSEEVQSKVEILQELMSIRAQWEPLEKIYELQGIPLLIRIIAMAHEYNKKGRIASFSAETIKSCLDVIGICTVAPKVIALLCDHIVIPEIGTIISMNLLLAAADGEIIADPDVQRAALRAVVNCVCAPLQRRGGNLARFSINGSAKKKSSMFNCEELIQKVWESVRSNNGIMMLLDLMRVKLPITDADSIRALACKALAGLARSDKVRQIISKLSMFTTGEIQTLMKDPILQEKRQEHVTFQKYALELMERVSGKAKPSGAEYEMSITSLHRANVVAQTRIQYDDKQLDQLIYQHLITKGYNKTAQLLHKEANVNLTTLTGVKSQNGTIAYRSPASNILYNTPRAGGPRDVSTTPRQNILPITTPTTTTTTSSLPLLTTTATPSRIKLSSSDSINQISSQSSTPSTPQTIKYQMSHTKKLSLTDKMQQNIVSTPNSSRSLQKSILRETAVTDGGLLSSPSSSLLSTTNHSSITLGSIIKEYLTNQHALCKYPMVTCPQFNLFEPHKCPDPRTKYSSPLNMTVRITRQQLGITNRRLDRRHIYSRFCPVKTFRANDIESSFTQCIYTPCQQYLILGTKSGDVKMFNTNTGIEEASYTCHDNHIKRLECNKKGNLLLTSTAWRAPHSALWTMDTMFDMKIQFNDESHVEFGKQNQNRIIGTQLDNNLATIYDVGTGKLLMSLKPERGNAYTDNRATFSMNDELVLSDGILWDVNSGKEIHKFDKLNDTLNGVFHPNCTQVVSNSEVWDLRTFHLLNIVPELNQMDILFSPINNIIYAVACEQDDDDESYLSSFRTFDAFDYSSIATFDVKKWIYSLACNKFDTQIAVVENNDNYDSVQESQVRIYDVGRKRDDDDEADEDDDEDIDASDDDNGSNTGSDVSDVQDGDNEDDDNSDDLILGDNDDDDDDVDDDDDDDDGDDDDIGDLDDDDGDSANSSSSDYESDPELRNEYNMSDIEEFLNRDI